MDARFPRSARVRTRADFTRVFDAGRRCGTPLLGLHWCDDGQPPRLGLAVSRKVDPRAVGRNRIKRALRETFRHHRQALRPGSYVVVARPEAARASGVVLATTLLNLLQRAGALPGSGGAGTMPASASGHMSSLAPSPPIPPPPTRAG
jgi:ribonuclease P protein component